MQRHLDCGKHERALERETLTNRAVKVYGEKLEGETPSVPEIIANSRPDIIPDSCRKVPMGWALRAGAPRKRFTSSQKAYLTAKFKLGEQSGQKADPASVARAMVSAKDASGNRPFTSDDFLTANQIAAFFSRLAAKKTLQDDEELSDDDLEAAASEARAVECGFKGTGA